MPEESEGQLELNRVLSSLSVAPTHCAQHDEKEWDREIETRIEELGAGKHVGISLDQAKKRIVLRVSGRA
jgi:hypothetical protein